MAEFTPEELAAEAATDESQIPASEAVIEQPQDQGQPRDESGRFAPKDGEHQEDPTDGRLPPNVYKAVKGERDAHKETKEQLRVAQEALQTIAAARARLAEAKPAEQAPAPGDDNGLEYLRSRVNELAQDRDTRQQREDAQYIDSQERNVLHQTLVESENAFRAQKPDYDNATNHLIQARARQLQLLGVPDAQIGAALQEEAADLAKTAVSQGRDPAELIYSYAQLYGYAPQQGQQSGNPMFDAIARGQKGRTLATARGSGGNVVDLNTLAQSIASMSDEEISANMRDPDFARAFAAVG